MTDEAYVSRPEPVKPPTRAERRRMAREARAAAGLGAVIVLENWRSLLIKSVDSLVTEIGFRGVEAILEMDATDMAGEKGKHNPSRTARRYGYARTYVSFGGRKVELRKPRLRTVDNTREVPLESVALLHDEETLRSRVLDVLVGTSQRDYSRSVHGIVETSRTEYGDSKTTAGRRFRRALDPIVGKARTRPIDQEILVVYMDGIGYGDHLVIAAMGMTGDGRKEILGLEPGTTEDTTACRRLLENLIDRGLSPEVRRLFVLDGGKGLHAAVKQVFQDRAVVQRCVQHKIRNVLEKLPESARQEVLRQFARALGEPNGEKAQQRLEMLARSLEESGYAKAAASLREGLEELVTVNRLGLSSAIRRLLRTTNPIESAFSQSGRQAARVRRWQNGRQVLRWVGFGLWRVEPAFRPLLTAQQVAELRAALRKELNTSALPPTEAA